MKDRRRVPRRDITMRVGLLIQGLYTVQWAQQLGEGGMLIEAGQPLEIGQKLLVSFRVPFGHHVVMKAQVRYMDSKLTNAFGIEFLNISFPVKREIRNFVASQAFETTLT